MNPQPKHLFQSERLGFRNWIADDIEKMSVINADPSVMEFFPATATSEQTAAFITKMQQHFADKGFCYFAVDELETGTFIGFIGLMEQTYEAPFTPCVDIGWRLATSAWNKGFATEGARRCLEYAFDITKLKTVVATAPLINIRSISVMKKTGMKWKLEFNHPRLIDFERLRNCVCYEISNKQDLA